LGEPVVGRQLPPTKPRQLPPTEPRQLSAKLDRQSPPIKPRLLSTKLVVNGPLSNVDRSLPTELVVAKVLSVQFTGMVDRLLSAKLVVDRPLSDVDRLLSTEFVVDRPPSAVAPNVDSWVVSRATPTYGRLSSAKSRGVRVRIRVLGFP
jgi:hypothetical protein